MYTDDFMTLGGYDEETNEWISVYGIDAPATYPVEVFAHTKTPGLYRLKNAYGEAYPNNEEGDWDTSMDYYLEIDATKSDYVFITKQELGNDWGDGMFSVESDGAYYMDSWGVTPEEVAATFAEYEMDSPFGTLVDNIITFPADAFTVYLGEDSFYGNHNGAFKLDLNDTPSESDVKAARFAQRMRAHKRINANAKRMKLNGKVRFKLNARLNKGGLK